MLPWALNSCWADDPDPDSGASCLVSDETTAVGGEDPLLLPIDRQRFPIVPHAGAMGSQEVLLWGFRADDRDLYIVVWREDETAPVVVVRQLVTPQEGYAKLWVRGLRSGTRYHFALVNDSASSRSAESRFQTAPAPGCAPVVQVAATACTHQRNSPFAALERMAERKPDVFLQLGDMVYNDSATRSAVETRANGDEETAKGFYRRNWKTALQDPGYEAILSSTGSYFTWDDHEVTDNSRLYELDPDDYRFAADRYFETLAQAQVETGRFWSTYRWGDSVEFFVLDCRSERQEETREGAEAIYISRAQMDWLKSALADSPCHFKAILTSVPITAWPELLSVVIDDRWEGYRSQREELLDWIVEEDVSNVFFISGDFHCGAVTRVEPSGPRSGLYEVLVGPGGNANNPLALLWELGSDGTRADLAPADQFLFLRSQPAGTMITFDPSRNLVTVEFLDPDSGASLTKIELSPGQLSPPSG